MSNARTNRPRHWPIARLLLASILYLPSLATAQGPAYLVKDINTGVDPFASSDPSDFVAVGRTLYFAAADTTHGRELWKSDGTDATTTLVADIHPGPDSSGVGNLVNANGTLFFFADDGHTGAALWKSDGTSSGTVLVTHVHPGVADYSLSQLTSVGRAVFFVVAEGNGVALWTSDGSDPGTIPVLVSATDRQLFGLTRLTNVGGTLFFNADLVNGNALWRSDGTPAGTQAIVGAGAAVNPTDVNGVLYYFGPGSFGTATLWRSDGTVAGTRRVGGSVLQFPDGYPELAHVNGTVFFTGFDDSSGVELWKSDGTTPGTMRVFDINPGYGSAPRSLTNVAGTLFFSAYDGENDALWTSDGSAAGTIRVKTIRAMNLTAVGDSVFFLVSADTRQTELWKSDGTEAGTMLVRAFTSGPGTPYVSVTNLTSGNGTLFFTANDGVTGNELWRSDGTSAGTVLVKNINVGPVPSASSNPTGLVDVGGTALFVAREPTHGRELWRSDGSATGTVLVKDINAGIADAFPEYCTSPLTNAEGVILFSADDGLHGGELWTSDGTDGGTVLVKDINPGPASAFPTDLCPPPRTAFAGAVFFAADDGVNGVELWRSDGTEAGTVRVADINPGPDGSSPSALTVVNSMLYFAASDGRTGPELWKSDGTTAGTMRVSDINPDQSDYSPPTFLTDVSGTLFFAQRDGSTRNGPGRALWKSDGTARGTTRVTDVFPNEYGFGPSELINFDGRLFFSAFTALWTSSGTPATTAILKDTNPYLNGAPQALTVVGDTLYFSAARLLPNLHLSGRELWKSDGSAAGTMPLTITSFAAAGAEPADLTDVDGTLFFTATDANADRQLWKSNGTQRTTVRIQEIGAGDANSAPASLGVAGTRLFFSVDDGITGRELWALPLSAFFPGCAGDCAQKGSVTVDDLVTAGRIALGETPLDDCTAADGDHNGAVTVDELVDAVNNALSGCR